MFIRTWRGACALALTSTAILGACSSATTTTKSATSGAPVTTKAGAATTKAAAVVTTVSITAIPKPKVKIPATLPTKLVITDLKEGTGPAAENGMTVTVHYVGVRSADGTEFDNSFDRGEPFPVQLGAGGVIKGWDQGLVGAKAGGLRQLDIPADLAYGDSPQGEVIKPGDALTFVVDIVSIKPAPKPLPATVAANEPKLTVTGGPNVTTTVTEDLVAGTGDPVKAGDTLAVQIQAFRGDTGQQIDSTWKAPTAIALSTNPKETIAGLANGVIGMKVGGRRQLKIPFAEGFGAAGNEKMGLPANTDVIVVVDLISIQ
jgi:FKBP-type peptidyl-prolyl cis-trans isomerase